MTEQVKFVDDCQEGSSLWKDPKLKEIFMKGRHYQIPRLVPEPDDCYLQMPLTIPESIRKEVDFIFLLKEDPDQTKSFFDVMGQNFTSLADFNKVFEKLTLKVDRHVIKKSNIL